MAAKQIIAVVGGLGLQGSGVVEAILADGTFAARAITRDVSSDKAKAAAARGIQVVAANLDDPASLVAAFAGAFGVFAVTNFFETYSVEAEQAHAKNMADAAKTAGIQHVVWSTLEDTRTIFPLSDSRIQTIGGKYKVPHFDSKGEANKFFTAAGVPTTFLNTSCYYSNFLGLMTPRRNPDGTATLALPMSADIKLPLIAVEDIGKCALSVFKRPALINQTIGIATEHLTGPEIAAVFTAALGITVNYYPMPLDAFRALGFPGADDIGNMFSYFEQATHSVRAMRSLETTHEFLSRDLVPFARWVEANKAAFKI